MPPRKLPTSNFDPGFLVELIVGVSVTEEETDVTELLCAGVVTEASFVWVVFWGTEPV